MPLAGDQALGPSEGQRVPFCWRIRISGGVALHHSR